MKRRGLELERRKTVGGWIRCRKCLESRNSLVTGLQESQRAIAVRLDAAKAAIGYENPRLAAIEKEQARRGLTLEELVLQAHAYVRNENDWTGLGSA